MQPSPEVAFKVGDKVRWKQPTEGVVSEVHRGYFCVDYGNGNTWSYDLKEEGEQFEIRK